MKKVIFLLVIVLSIFCTTACTSDDTTNSNQSTNEKTESQTEKQVENETLNEFLRTPIEACPSKILGSSIVSINQTSNLSASYELQHIDNEDYLILNVSAPSDHFKIKLGLKEKRIFIADAEVESIKANMTDESQISQYSIIGAQALLCD